MEAKTIYTYLGALAVIMLVSAYKNKYGDANSKTDALIREYLLNESPLYGANKPKLWIHTVYGVNARAWRTGARNTTDLNQPYIHTLIKTVINKCGNDFNICLIDDASFKKLLPDFETEGSLTKTQRTHALMQLLYVYGGIVLPNTFLCLRSLTPLLADSGNPKFGAGTAVMSAHSFCPKLRELIDQWNTVTPVHASSEEVFVNKQQKLLAKVGVEFVDPRLLGLADRKGKPILLDDVMSENYISLPEDVYGILIDGEEVLRRAKYKWLAYMSTSELMQTNLVLVKYMKSALVDEAFMPNEKHSIMAI
jgi:hypothetical protein